MMRKGVTPHYAAEAYEIDHVGDTLVAYAPTQRISNRGATLTGPLLTITLSAPAEGVIKVRIVHFAGQSGCGPEFALEEDPAHHPVINVEDDRAELTSGGLTARVGRKDGWSLEFLAGERRLTFSPFRGLGYMEVEGEGAFLHEQLKLDVGETVYGLGERFSAFVKNGQVVDIWNKDGGTGSEQAYKNVPFYLTNRGYGVFVNTPGPVSFEVASEKVSAVQFSVPGEVLEYCIILGPTPKEVLCRYTALTGRPALPPAWSFGLWLSTSFTTNYDEQTVSGFIDEMARRDLPLHVFHFDCFWMREYQWCDFCWDPRVFPDPAGMLARLKSRGLHICVWINPYIGQKSPLFAEGVAHGYLLKKPNGDVWQSDQWQPGMGIVDFTNPQAKDWFCGHLERLIDMGVDALKTDFGERIPTDVAWHDGSDPILMHNYFPQLYNRAVFELLERKRGAGEAVLFARSATAGGQKFPVHWGGDCYSDFPSMAESLRGGLSLCLSGFAFWSHDIGGFEGLPPAAVYKRWVAFGLLSSHSRLHGSSSVRVPWAYDEEACDVLRTFTKLKCRLMPYLFAKAVEAHETGVPVMRAMLLEFPDDPTCHVLDRQYMLGDALLVAPVFAESGEVEFYLPEGRWTSLFTGETVEGGAWRRETHGFLSLPLYVRPNSLLPVGAVDDRPDYSFAEGVTCELYSLEDGATATARVVERDGRTVGTVTIRHADGEFHAESSGIDAELLAVGLRGLEGMPQTERGFIVRLTSNQPVSVKIN